MTVDRIRLIHAWETVASLKEWRKRAEAAGQPLSSLENDAYHMRLAALMRAERDAVRQ